MTMVVARLFVVAVGRQQQSYVIIYLIDYFSKVSLGLSFGSFQDILSDIRHKGNM